MRLLVVSHTPHHRTADGLAGWGATVRELDYLSNLFDSVCHVAPVHTEPSSESAATYTSERIRVHAVPAAGGDSWQDKAAILRRLPAHSRAIREELARADAVHVRCPAAISLCALALLRAERWRGPLWIKYAGSWGGYPGEPLSYRFQRGWLAADWANASVTVNGNWPGQPRHVLSFFNPSLSLEELRKAREAASGKRLEDPVRLLFVGRADESKGLPQVLAIVKNLASSGIACEAEVVGDGPELERFRSMADEMGVGGCTRFLGWLSRQDLNRAYERAHFLVLPSRAEGWPKVLSEAMAFGAVPLAGAVGSIPEYLQRFRAGRALDPGGPGVFADAIRAYLGDREAWARESALAAEAAGNFTYENYLDAVRKLFERPC